MIAAPLLACAALRHPVAAALVMSLLLWIVVLVGAALLCTGVLS
jgi:hypothetical protein